MTTVVGERLRVLPNRLRATNRKLPSGGGTAVVFPAPCVPRLAQASEEDLSEQSESVQPLLLCTCVKDARGEDRRHIHNSGGGYACFEGRTSENESELLVSC